MFSYFLITFVYQNIKREYHFYSCCNDTRPFSWPTSGEETTKMYVVYEYGHINVVKLRKYFVLIDIKLRNYYIFQNLLQFFLNVILNNCVYIYISLIDKSAKNILTQK